MTAKARSASAAPLAVLWERPTGIGRAEVVLVNEPLGY